MEETPSKATEIMIVSKNDSEESQEFLPVRKQTQDQTFLQKYKTFIIPCVLSIFCISINSEFSLKLHPRTILVAACFWTLALARIGGAKNAKIQLTALKRLGLFLLFKGLYEYVRSGVNGDYDLALKHADAIVWFERSIHLFFERDFQAFFYNTLYPIIWFSNRYYEQQHFVQIVIGLLLNIVYGKFSNEIAFHTLNLSALVVFYNFPTCPPRLWTSDPNIQFIDTKDPDSIYSKSFEHEGNPFAAVPSMHCAWALWASTIQIDVTQHWKYEFLIKAWAIFHVVCTAFVVIVTGNHWWSDAVIGWSLCTIALLTREKIATCLEVISFACGECILSTPLGKLKSVETFFEEKEDEIQLARHRSFN